MTHLQSHPTTEIYEKTYPITVDFHIRSDMALVKSHQVTLQSQSGGAWIFRAQGPTSWASGSFDSHSGALSLVEGQVLIVDGTAQETRTAGQYACEATLTQKAR